MRHWLLLYLLLSINAAAFVRFQTSSSISFPKAGLPYTDIRAKSLLDDPILLAPSPEPGKENEVIVSDSPAFGLQRTLYTHRRKLRAKAPSFDPGDCVYLASGPYRNARGTVLSTFRRAPGEPYLVSVVLDCRNERGIVRGPLSGYHGTSVTVRESQLIARPLFTPYAPPPLSSEENHGLDRRGGSRNGGTSKPLKSVLLARVFNCVRISELKWIFDRMRRNGVQGALPYQAVAIQIARGFNAPQDDVDTVALVTDVLERIRLELEKGYTEEDRPSIPWLAWALGVLRNRGMLKDDSLLSPIYKFIRDVVISGKLSDLTQGEIALMASGFRQCFRYRNDVLHRLAMIYSYVPAKGVIPRYATSLAASLAHARQVHPAFSRLMYEVVKEEHALLSPSGAVYMLEYLYNDPATPQEVKDVLLACCSVAEFLKPNSTPYGPSHSLALRLAWLSEREMSELLHALRTGECEMPPSVAASALLNPRCRVPNHELTRLLLVRASRIFGTLSVKAHKALLTAARRMKECPREVFDALDRYLSGLDADRVLDATTAQSLAQFLPSIPDSRPESQRLVLEHIERFITFTLTILREKAIDVKQRKSVMAKATTCLQYIPMLGFELDSLARKSAELLRNGLPFAYDRLSVLLGIMAVQSISPSYFNAASDAARALIADSSVALPPDVAPLAELLLILRMEAEGSKKLESDLMHLRLPELPPASTKKAVKPLPHRDVRDFSVLFALLVRSRLCEDWGGVLATAYVFAEDNIEALSSADLLLLRDSLVSLGAFDAKWEGLIASVAKGIDAVI
ncbi:phage antirepressor domain-containing protein, putative [Babesia ovata]|uniref:Phage antirepressor domain-containing protein, putative n=1 Tax=Babesia ovata TaxID=189622 RepID=A0A2H6KCL1_9APIC|nr:phage antirepressor domain-containing protein, putative [Babesia ovata]GBE60731.1 phage antirepressor domain-containing protein, putative [Babesia ovata]